VLANIVGWLRRAPKDLGKMSQSMEKDPRLEKEIWKLAARIQRNSPTQLAESFLKDRLNLHPTRGAEKQSGAVYRPRTFPRNCRRSNHTLPPKIIEYREIAKLTSTYV